LKRYAKNALAECGHLPRDVARVLYVAAIVRGRLAGIPGMTSPDRAGVEREARRCLTYGWLPPELRALLRGCGPGGR